MLPPTCGLGQEGKITDWDGRDTKLRSLKNCATIEDRQELLLSGCHFFVPELEVSAVLLFPILVGVDENAQAAKDREPTVVASTPALPERYAVSAAGKRSPGALWVGFMGAGPSATL